MADDNSFNLRCLNPARPSNGEGNNSIILRAIYETIPNTDKLIQISIRI